MDRVILHVDVNNAFLSWTAIDRLKNGETIDIPIFTVKPNSLFALKFISFAIS